MDSTTPYTFRLGRDAEDHAVVEIDGVDHTRSVRAVNIAVEAGTPVAEVTLILSPLADRTTFEGLATVVVGEAAQAGPTPAVWLTHIDPKELQDAALQRLDLGTGGTAMAEAILRQLIEWAEGR